MPLDGMTQPINTKTITKEKLIYLYFKRGLDILFCILFAPLFAIVCFIFSILIKLDSKGSAFYTQNRVGKDGHIFKIYKLRSMAIDSEQESGAVWAQKNDPRVTRIGTFIRRTRVDELPQVWNILKGDMSLIGPRPERADLTEQFAKEVPDFKKRLAMRPGITGLAQVNGGYELTPAEKLKYDLKYIQNCSLLLDIQISWKTVFVLLTGHGAR